MACVLAAGILHMTYVGESVEVVGGAATVGVDLVMSSMEVMMQYVVPEVTVVVEELSYAGTGNLKKMRKMMQMDRYPHHQQMMKMKMSSKGWDMAV